MAEEKTMQKDEAIKILARHLMQCGMMMPIEWVQKNGEGSEFMQAYEMAMDALKNEPVHCYECKHEDGGYCNHFGYYGYAPTVFEDDFCSRGERKEDNG